MKKYNQNQKHPVIHINTTFEEIANAIEECIEERDYEMQEILEDYRNYCYNDNLITAPDSWKYSRVQLAGTTFDFNITENVYYDDVNRGFRPHDYLGLYKEKSVRAVGKITAIIKATFHEDLTEYKVERGNLTEEMKDKIYRAVADGKNYGYTFVETRFFFVEKFYLMDFKKSSPGAPMGTRVFDLTRWINTPNYTAEVIAKELSEMFWQ